MNKLSIFLVDVPFLFINILIGAVILIAVFYLWKENRSDTKKRNRQHELPQGEINETPEKEKQDDDTQSGSDLLVIPHTKPETFSEQTATKQENLSTAKVPKEAKFTQPVSNSSEQKEKEASFTVDDIPSPKSMHAIPISQKNAKLIYENQEDQFQTSLTKTGYDPSPEFREKEGLYPRIYMPESGTLIRIPRLRNTNARGYCEEKFERILHRTFSFLEITSKAILPMDDNGNYIRPDICVILHGIGLNLYMDIEIDEPYEAQTGQALHFDGEDLLRDRWMQRRGWMVIRFTEKQIHKYPTSCMAFIARVIRSVYPLFDIPSVVEYEKFPPTENVWTEQQAKEYQLIHLREKYLDIENFSQKEIADKIEDLGSFTPTERQIESLINK